jgi:hypothetical protein
VRSARRTVAVAVAAVVTGILTLAAPGAADAAVCDRVAAPGGDDGAAGTVREPLRTPQALADALRPGMTGCLRRGTYDEPGVLAIRRGGTDAAPVVLRSYPGERATLRPEGLLHVRRAAANVSLRLLDVDGARNRDDVTIWIEGRRALLADLDVGNGGAGTSCVLIGGGQPVPGVRILRSRIHDCGASERFDHGVYAASAVGLTMTRNAIWNAAAWGVQLYPSAQGARIELNVLDDNGGGLVIGGAGTRASTDNLVQYNVVSNPRHFPAVGEHWEDVVGTGNRVVRNCVWPATAVGSETPVGFVAAGNVTAEPAYTDRGARDYRLLPGDPCTTLLTSAAAR